MFKFAKIANNETKLCHVGLGSDDEYYKSIGFEQMEVEQAYNGDWYLKGFAPEQPEEEKKQAKINNLKAQLAATDYKIIKCSECQLAGLDLPYDIAALHAERQAIRDKINELEQ